jgi:hypothetical protein
VGRNGQAAEGGDRGVAERAAVELEQVVGAGDQLPLRLGGGTASGAFVRKRTSANN